MLCTPIFMFIKLISNIHFMLIILLLTNLFRLNSSHGAGVPPGEPTAVHDAPYQPPSAPDGVSRPSSDEGENEVGEENAERLDCHYSGSHPRPAAVSPHIPPPPFTALYDCSPFDRSGFSLLCSLLAVGEMSAVWFWSFSAVDM